MKTAKSESIIYDAIHQVMSFDPDLSEMLMDLLDLPVFQRLRQIKQLAMAEMVFPAACHSRFAHTIGTCHLAIRILDQLGKAVDIHPDLRRHVAVGALLHDIGHGPFSHSFESFLHTATGLELHHEDWTEYFLDDQELNETLARYDIDPELVEHLITKKGETRKQVFGTYKHIPNLLLGSDVIASQLDADRLDYLLRDSHFCGVSYGTYDIGWLIKQLVPVSTSSGLRLGISSKGVGVVENFLLARRLMYKNIYYHPKLIALGHLLVDMLLEVEKLVNDDDGLIHALGDPLSSFLTHADREHYSNSKSFRDAKFDSYRYLCDFDIWNMIRQIGHPSFHDNKKHHRLKEIAARFSHRHCPKMIQVRHDKHAKQQIDAFRKSHSCQPWELRLVEINFNLYATKEDPILIGEKPIGQVAPEHGIPVRLNDRSELVQHLSDRIEPQYYLMIDQDFYGRNRDSIHHIVS